MKLSHLALVVVLSAATAFGVTKYAPQTTTTALAKESAFERVMRTNTLRCGYVIYPNFIERDVSTGKFSGLYYEFIEEMGRQLHLKIDWTEEAAIPTALEGLNTGRYDVMCAPFNATAGRARVAEFSHPVLFFPTFVYVREGDTRFDNNLAAINDPSIKVVALEGEMAQFIKEEDFPKAGLLSLPSMSDISQVFVSLVMKKADVAIVDSATGEPYIKNNPGKVRRVMASPIRLQAGGVSVAAGEESLKAMLNTAIDTLESSGFTQRHFIKTEEDRNYFFFPAKSWRKAGE